MNGRMDPPQYRTKLFGPQRGAMPLGFPSNFLSLQKFTILHQGFTRELPQSVQSWFYRILRCFMRSLNVAAVLFFAFALGSSQQSPDNSGAPADMQHGEHGRHHPGLAGTITAIDASSITVNTPNGTAAHIAITPDTQFRKDRAPAKISDFKVGDEIFVGGDVKDGVWQARFVGTRPTGRPGGGDFRAELGKRFIAGEVKAMQGTQLTILRPDGVTQNITVDEGTSFRKEGESITLADIKVGDHVFGRGELRNDVFVPTVLNVGQPRFMGRPPEGAPEPK
jgi:hypothetical protein